MVKSKLTLFIMLLLLLMHTHIRTYEKPEYFITLACFVFIGDCFFRATQTLVYDFLLIELDITRGKENTLHKIRNLHEV